MLKSMTKNLVLTWLCMTSKQYSIYQVIFERFVILNAHFLFESVSERESYIGPKENLDPVSSRRLVQLSFSSASKPIAYWYILQNLPVWTISNT